MFKSQNEGSFKLGFEPTITISHGFLITRFPPVQVTVNVGKFSWMLHKNGPKPSRSIDLGYVYQHASGNYLYSCRWETDGSLTLLQGVANGDLLRPLPLVMPVPDGVVFR